MSTNLIAMDWALNMIWNQGIVKKYLGPWCQWYTGEEKHLYRAFKMVELMQRDKVLDASYDPQRPCQGLLLELDGGSCRGYLLLLWSAFPDSGGEVSQTWCSLLKFYLATCVMWYVHPTAYNYCSLRVNSLITIVKYMWSVARTCYDIGVTVWLEAVGWSHSISLHGCNPHSLVQNYVQNNASFFECYCKSFPQPWTSMNYALVNTLAYRYLALAIEKW